MKKPIAILLLAVYLFNLGGYTLVFHYFIRQSEETITRQLDRDQYKEADLVQISIPLHLPYVQNSKGFERMEGSIENNGEQYNYVKRRLYNDTLYIMCVPNQQKTKLIKASSNYAGQANDFATGKKEKESTAKKISLNTEYSNAIIQYSFILPGAMATKPGTGLHFLLITPTIDRPGHPPQAAC